MTPKPRPTDFDAARRVERDLLAQLGLGAGASDAELETAHDGIVGFLRTAPQDLRTWAGRQISTTDEAYALLSDPAADLASLAPGALFAAAEPTRAPVTTATRSGTAIPGTPGRRVGPVARAIIAALGLVGALAIALFIYQSGAPAVPGFTGTPGPNASATPAVDAARVAALMQKIAANPKDTASLIGLGDLYYQAGDFKTAADWMAKAVAVDPKNTSALLGLGAAQFNIGDAPSAEKQWRAVLVVEPKNQEAYYDLGFMYLAQNPPDMANVTAMWQKVLDIDPTTTYAANVKTHFASFASPSPAASGVPASGVPATPAPSPTASGG
jgi:cytochrome c-type biogenesis protein CcmH/NrfG